MKVHQSDRASASTIARSVARSVDAYDLDEPQRRELTSLLAPRARGMADFLRNRACAGEQPWAALWNQGHGDLIEREHDRLLAALLA